MPPAKKIVDLKTLVGTAHPTIQAVHPVTAVVSPVYSDLASGGKVGAYSIIKGGEIVGPFSDPYVARDEAARRTQLDIERGVSNP